MTKKIFNVVIWSPDVAKNSESVVKRAFAESVSPEQAKKWLSVLGIRDIESFTKTTGINISGSLLMNFLVRSNGSFIDELRTEYGLPFGPSAIAVRTMRRIIEEPDSPKASADFIPPAIIRVARVMNFSWSDWLETIPQNKHNDFWQRIALKTHSRKMGKASHSVITHWLWGDMQSNTVHARLPSHVLARLIVAGTKHGVDQNIMSSAILTHVKCRQAIVWEKVQAYLLLLVSDKVLGASERAGIVEVAESGPLCALWRDAWLRESDISGAKNQPKITLQKKI